MNIYPSFDELISENFDIIVFYQKLFSDTYELYKKEEYYEILKIIDKNLFEKPHDSLMWAYKGYILHKLSYSDDGLFCADVSLNIDDANDFSWLLKSIILKSKQKVNESLICYKEFIVLKYHENISMKPVDVNINIIDLEINPNDNFNFSGQFRNIYSDKQSLLTENNLKKFEDNPLNDTQYYEILNKIVDTARKIFSDTINENFINFYSLSTYEKIMLITKSFVNVYYKSEGGELGEYTLNSIYLDDRLFDSNKINTLIHELSHHLLSEIFEQIMMQILDSEKTVIIEEFVSNFLFEDEYNLMDEYCAHAVEGRYTPHGYQKFSSFNAIYNSIYRKFNSDYVDLLIQLGNTFSKDILFIIQNFIDENLREDIYDQFKIDIKFAPDYEDIKQECRDVFKNEEKLDLINSILKENFERRCREV